MNQPFLNKYARIEKSNVIPINLNSITVGEKRALSCILANFLVLYRQNLPLELSFSTKTKNWLPKSGRIPLSCFLVIKNLLIREEYISVKIGYKSKRENVCSTMAALPKLNEMLFFMDAITPVVRAKHSSEPEIKEYEMPLNNIELTLLGGETHSELNFETTPPQFAEWENTLFAYNQLLLSNRFQVTSDHILSELFFDREGMSNTYSIKPNALIYKRVFHTETLEQEQLFGGRFYSSAVSLIHRSERASMLINGEPTSELDFKCLHLQLLRHRVGLDCYNGDGYELIPGQPKIARELVKIMFLLMINCNSSISAIRALNSKLQASKNDPTHVLFGASEFIANNPVYEPKNLVKALSEKHHEIAQFFFTAAWKELQRIESEIMHRVLGSLVKHSIPAFLVHDSLIVSSKNTEFLNVLLANAYAGLTNFLPIISIK